MQINPISYGYNTSFDATARIHLENGSTAMADVIHNDKGNIKKLSVKILKDRQELGAFTRSWKKGITYDAFLQSYWTENICKKLGITEEADQDKISDVIFDAEIYETMGENEEDIENRFADTLPDDAYSDVYPDGDYHLDEYI